MPEENQEVSKTGSSVVWIMVLAVIGGTFVLLSNGQTEKEQRAKNAEREARKAERLSQLSILKKEFDRLETDPCGTALAFTKAGEMWFVRAYSDANSMPIHSLFPDAKNKIIRIVETIGAGDDVTLTELLRFTGECPPALY